MSKMDSIEITGISVDEAVKEALEQLGATEDEVSFEVLVTPRVGMLGLGTRYAKVRVTRKSALAAANPPKSKSQKQELQITEDLLYLAVGQLASLDAG